MKIAYLSGAYKNAGDFLIEKRALELIRYVLPDAQISRMLRNEIRENADRINACDCAVIGGGPVYQEDLSGYLPLDVCINEIKPPVMIMGGGWYGVSGASSAVRSYHFEEKTKQFLGKVYESDWGLSCRDPQTVSVLKNAGFEDSRMTGCPAWYNLPFVENTEIRNSGEIRTIAVSDPARLWNLEGAVSVTEYLRSRFPDAKIKFVFHRGMKHDRYTSEKTEKACMACAEKLEKSGVEILDISSGAEGFSVYDDCDLHVGYRVHAHIYNISIRHRSILIEEDGRGAGVNAALQLPRICAYNDYWQPGSGRLRKLYVKSGRNINPDVVKELGVWLDIQRDTGWEYLENAMKLTKRYFGLMTEYVRQLER